MTSGQADWTGRGIVSFDFAFNLQKNATPIVFDSATDATEYDVTSSSYVLVKTFADFNSTTYDNGLSSGITIELHAQAKRVSVGTTATVKSEIDGADAQTDTATTTSYTSILNTHTKTTGTALTLKVYLKTNNGTQAFIRNIFYRIKLNYDKSELIPSDFGVKALYLKSILLPDGASVKLNNDPEQTLTNATGSNITINYETTVNISKIEFLTGTPQVTFYGN